MLDRLGITLPIIQAPMAGVSTPTLAAEVSNAGGLGSISVGASDPISAHAMINELSSKTDKAFNINLFVHTPPKSNSARETAWVKLLEPYFSEFDAPPPASLRPIYKSFNEDAEMLAMLLETKPSVVSFHFGLPPQAAIEALKSAGTFLLASATSIEEARKIERAGIDAIVAQGIEAGGHRGVFDLNADDDQLGIFALTRLLVREVNLPIISAGGIMDGAGIAAALNLGAIAAQLGTAFVACPESAADEEYRNALRGNGAYHTRLTSVISGRPARAIPNRFTAVGDALSNQKPPEYPTAYDAGKALHHAAKIKGEHGFGAHWAGQGAPLSRSLPARELMSQLAQELHAAQLRQRLDANGG